MTTKAVLVDDERLARRSLRALLAEHPEMEIVGEASSIRRAAELIATERPEVVFLDIQMPGGSGFELLAQLDDPPAIVFVTAYDEYAIRAFEVNALDDLLKPVEPARLALALRRLHAHMGHAESSGGPYTADDQVLIKTARRCFFLPVARIAAIRAADNYSYVICDSGDEHLVRKSLKDWEAMLPADRFEALDRSVVVNWQLVKTWSFRGRTLDLYLGRASAPLESGRAAAQHFKTRVIPKLAGFAIGAGGEYAIGHEDHDHGKAFHPAHADPGEERKSV